jgi:hypothetical protein
MRIATFLTFLLLALAAGTTARAADVDVDLELVLAVDVSYSMDFDELQLQREGYIAALTSKQVLDAIAEGITGKIAVTYVEWAGSSDQDTIVGWQVIDGLASAEAFTAKLAAAPVKRAYRTSISSALAYSAPLFDRNGYAGLRQAIDVSGDGANNQGPVVTTIRDEVLARGIVINGLPLLLKRASYGMMDLVDLDIYYRDCVIGGPGAFMVPVRERGQFAEAIRTKLILEIAGREPQPLFMHAAGPATVSCTIGEQQWMERFGP